MLIQTLSLDDPAWKAALAGLPHDLYHTPEYVRIDARRLQAEAEAIVIADGERRFFMPYLLRSCGQLFSGEFDSLYDVVSPYGYPGILLSEAGKTPQFAAQAWSALCDYWRSKGICSAFLRMHPILGDGFETWFPPGTLCNSGQTVAVDLHLDEATSWKQISHNHRRTIEKCRKFGFVASVVPLGGVLEPFVDIYTQTMDRVGAGDSYYFNREYFTALAEMPGVSCCIVESGNHIIAACLSFESHGIVQFHLGGTATEFYRQSPFHLCLYESMLWAKRRGNRWLHLGGGVGGNNDQLLKFKASFSPLQFRYHTARVVLDESQYGRLVETAARAGETSPTALLESSFFPAYRAPSVVHTVSSG